MATSRKNEAMCCVSIGYRTYLVPLANGLKLVALMQDAFEIERDYMKGRSDDTYTVKRARPEVSLELVRPQQLHDEQVPAPLALSAPRRS